jgi:hypothetical protein
LGRVPHGTEFGDKICILLGGCVPFVPRESSDDYFKFIEECYVYGIMGGEVWKVKI